MTVDPKWRLRRFLQVTCVALAFGQHMPVQAQQPHYELDTSGKGAVLCARAIYWSAHLFGELCPSHADPDYQTFLVEALRDLDTFIVANSDVTREQLASQAAEDRASMMKLWTQFSADAESRGVKACEIHRDGQLGYAKLRQTSVAMLRAQLADSLSVPRKLLMNPCL